MYSPKVSVIVPVYNCENYIEKCLGSIISQTLQPIELILIDDGSTDKTASIIDKFALAYNNIVVVHQENEGVSSARNAGLILAQGEYIGFVDADDYVAPEMFEKLYIAAKRFDADMAMCDYNNVYRLKTVRDVLQLKDRQIDIEDIGLHSFYLEYIMVCRVLWNKIYKTSLVRSAGLYFDMHDGEDFLFCIELSSHLKRISTISEGLYYYVQRKNSIMNDSKPSKQSPNLIDQFVNRIQNNSVYRAAAGDIIYHYIFASMFAGFMFSPSCNHKTRAYFDSQIKKMRTWADFPQFCYLITKTNLLSGLYKTGAISFRFYQIMKLKFSFCLMERDNLAVWFMYMVSKLIYLKKRRFSKNLFS